jgi:O-antigen/teichoic acid export membrane protein
MSMSSDAPAQPSRSSVDAVRVGAKRHRFNLSVPYLVSRCGASFVLQMSEAAVLSVVLILFARVLGSHSFGHYAYALTLATILVMFARLGFDVTSVRYVSQYLVAEQYGLLRGYLRFAIGSILVISALVVVAFVGATISIKGLMSSELAHSCIAAAALIPCLAALHVLCAMLRGYNRTVLSRLPQGAIVPAVLLAGAAIVFLVKMQGSVVPAWMLVALHIVAVACGLVATIFWLFAASRSYPAADTTRFESRKWLKSAGLLVLLGGLTKLHAELDTLMLGVLEGTEQAGIYAIVTRIGGIPMLICVATTAIVSPAMAGLASLGESANLARLYRNSVGLLIAASLPVAGLLWLLGKPILEFIGPNFTIGYHALLILLAANVVHNVFGPVGVLLNMAGHEWTTVRVFAVSVALNAVLNLLLIPRYGLAGAAMGTGVALLLIQVLLTREAWRKLHLPAPAFQFLRQRLRWQST